MVLRKHEKEKNSRDKNVSQTFQRILENAKISLLSQGQVDACYVSTKSVRRRTEPR